MLEAPSVFLFLDVDGVLNSSVSRTERLGQGMTMREAGLPTAEHLARLGQIAAATECRIVLSSSWRLDPVDNELICKQLQGAGLATPIGSTPDLASGSSGGGSDRVNEILSWLSQRALEDAVWLAIDDLDLHGWYPHRIDREHFELTYDNLGLSEANVESAIAKLRRQLANVASPPAAAPSAAATPRATPCSLGQLDTPWHLQEMQAALLESVKALMLTRPDDPLDFVAEHLRASASTASPASAAAPASTASTAAIGVAHDKGKLEYFAAVKPALDAAFSRVVTDAYTRRPADWREFLADGLHAQSAFLGARFEDGALALAARGVLAGPAAAAAPAEKFYWEFDRSMIGPETMAEEQGSRVRFGRTATALLEAAPHPRPWAVSLRLKRASQCYEVDCDSVGMRLPSATLDTSLAKPLQGAEPSAQGSPSVAEGGEAAVGEAAGSEKVADGGEAADKGVYKGETSSAPGYLEAVALSTAGSFLVHTRMGLLPPSTLESFAVMDEIRLGVDEEGTLSIAKNGVELARYAGVRDGWRFAVSAGRMGVWEIVDEPRWPAVQMALDTREHPRAFVRADYAEDEVRIAPTRTWAAMMDKRNRVHMGRLSQLASYAERQAQREQAELDAQLEAYEALFVPPEGAASASAAVPPPEIRPDDALRAAQPPRMLARKRISFGAQGADLVSEVRDVVVGADPRTAVRTSDPDI